MLPDGAYVALALCSVLVLHLAGRPLPPGLGPWLTERFDEMEAHLRTKVTKVLCLDPCLDVCAAVAQFAIFSEDRPSRLQWCIPPP